MTKRLPPFGREILDARQRGYRPRKLGFGHLIINLDWQAPHAAMQRIVIPPDMPASSVNLSFVAGLHLTLIVGGDDVQRASDVAAECLKAGAEIVDVVDLPALAAGDDPAACWTRKTQAEGLHHGA
jgi:hypothetical protein